MLCPCSAPLSRPGLRVVLSRRALTKRTPTRRAVNWPVLGGDHDRYFCCRDANPHRGLTVRAEAGFRFYASDHAFVGLEGRSYKRLEDIRADVRRLAEAPALPAPSQRRGRNRAQRGQ